METKVKDEKDFLYEAFYSAYRPSLDRYCHSLINDCYAEDIVSDSFVLLYVKWDLLLSHETPVLLKWMYTTVRNKTLRFGLNQKKEKDQSILKDLYDRINSEKRDRVSDAKLFHAIFDLIPYLDVDQQNFFHALMDYNMDYSELSIIYHKSEATLRQQKSRLMKKLITLYHKKN